MNLEDLSMELQAIVDDEEHMPTSQKKGKPDIADRPKGPCNFLADALRESRQIFNTQTANAQITNHWDQ